MAREVTRNHGQDAATSVSPKTANLDIGSMNFEIFPLLKKVREWNSDWKPEFLARARDLALPGELATLECAVRHLLLRGVHFIDEGLGRTPILVQVVSGTLGGAAVPDRCMPWGR